jgi:hypothetical protein
MLCRSIWARRDRTRRTFSLFHSYHTPRIASHRPPSTTKALQPPDGDEGLLVNPEGRKVITSQYHGEGLFISTEDLKKNAEALNITIIGFDEDPQSDALRITYTISKVLRRARDVRSKFFEVAQKIYIEEVNTRRGGGNILSLLPHLKKPDDSDGIITTSDGKWKILEKHHGRYEMSL